jgi:hypothetical protein
LEWEQPPLAPLSPQQEVCMEFNQTLLDKKAEQLTQPELFERIVYKIKRKYNFQITDAEAHAAARTMIGFTQTLLELSSDNGNVKP